ncbi:diguanylate cyclase domain-containing protein [Streptococcus equinus]|uniref:sensor domain-containing diguanylate cyclase n=1 Tax=Streptococcus equinus TaxID=1335 RepID=UPI003BF806A4
MFVRKVKVLLVKYQGLLTYFGAITALNLLLKLAYDEIMIKHKSPAELLLSIIILGATIFASYLTRRRNMLSYFILESSDAINMYALDLNYRLISFNRNDVRLMQEVFGFTPKIGESPLKYLGEERAIILKEKIERAKNGENFTFLDTIHHKDETYYWQNMFSPIYNRKGKIIGVFSLVVDVTEQRKKELEIQKMAYEDALTKVHNRRYIEYAFEKCITDKEESITVIMSDLNKFKEANDTYGHAVGDQILVDFGKILTKIMPKDAIVARLGGDEFAVLLPGFTERQIGFLINLIRIEMIVKQLPVTASFGFYIDSYKSQKSFSDFCIRADERMYRDKNQKG